MNFKVEGSRPVGRPKTWRKGVEENMGELHINEEMARDRNQWRQLISHRISIVLGKEGRKTIMMIMMVDAVKLLLSSIVPTWDSLHDNIVNQCNLESFHSLYKNDISKDTVKIK